MIASPNIKIATQTKMTDLILLTAILLKKPDFKAEFTNF